MKNETIAFYNIQELDSLLRDLDSSQTLVQIFCAQNDRKEIEEIQHYFSTYFPLSKILGTTTDGVIYNDKVYYKSKSVVTVTRFEHTRLKASFVEHDDSFEMNFQSGRKLAKELVDEDTKVIISFTDGIYTNGEEFLNGISSINTKVVIAGGMAGDNGELQKTYVFDNKNITDKGVVGVSLSSEYLNVYADYSFDWQPIGKKLKVTKALKNRIYEIDAMPAVEVYAKYMGRELAQNLPKVGIEFPLIFEKEGMNIGRAVLLKHNDGSLTFAGNVQEGEYVRFGVGNVDAILKNSDYHVEKVLNTIKYKPEAVFVYSCMARRRFMDKYIEEELQELNSLGTLSGFFTYGEFFHSQNKNDLLNESLTLLALSENKNILKHTQSHSSKHQHSFQISAEHVLAHLANTVSNELAELNDELEERIQISSDYIYKQAYFDKLTGLPNRLSLLKRVQECIGKTVFLVNIDDFTTINDFYGHTVGDIVLVKMSQLLKKFAIFEEIEIFKLPSDEFAIISNVRQNKETIENTIKKLLDFIDNEKFLINEHIVHVSVTVSAAYINEAHTGLANADMVLKVAKKSHKQYLIFDKDLQLSKKYELNLKMANEIKRAIEKDDIVPYFQAIFDIKTGKVDKYEALVRLRKEDGEILAPYFFLSISEKIKLYPKITKIMIEKTFAFFSKNGLNFSINLSFSDILNEKTRQYLFDKMAQYNIASQLTIEILETQEYSNENIVYEFTQDVYKHGATIAIDDFGSGFANFRHMTDIYCDYMKIDGSLIKNINNSKNDRLIVETIVIFAKKLGKKTIAEFVHSQEVYEIVKELGIDYAQGYHLGKPKADVR
ncbi:bifunctional diguanylate cyclase/phosphodiesterase [Sulfurimonas sp.]